MIRRTAFAIALGLTPAAAFADEQTMPQMDFKNPLTLDQIWWMVAILVVLYFVLSRWGLPQIGQVLEHRAAVIAHDLDVARTSKAQADEAVAVLTKTMNEARAAAQAQIAKAVSDAKAQARAKAMALQERLEAQLAESEAQIATARAAALAAIKPVAENTATVMLARLTGKTPASAVLSPEIEAALAARKAA